jgi:ferredoxin
MRHAEDELGSRQLGSPVVLDADALGALLELLGRDTDVRGPVVRDGAVVWGALRSIDELPTGIHDEQAPGSYALGDPVHGDGRRFAWAVGPQSPKPQFMPASDVVWRAEPVDGSLGAPVEPKPRTGAPIALFGARPCEVAALDILDTVLARGAYGDPAYRRRREGTLVVEVECTSPSGTCFCASMGTGPDARAVSDLTVCEIGPVDDPRYLVRSGSDRGDALLQGVSWRPATDEDLAERARLIDVATRSMGRSLDTAGLPAALDAAMEDARWADIAERCLGCGNCTLVCPTCFCTTVEDVSDLSGAVERRRSWSSCFDLGHSYMHGGPVRHSLGARYRQWLTHKLGTWWDQFGTSGCVGCGRCITWCPVGIDITAEAAALRAGDRAGATDAPATDGAGPS